MQIFKGKSGGILAGLAAGALWGLVFVAPRMVLGNDSASTGFSSVDLTAGRFLSYGLIAAVLMFIGHYFGSGSKKLPTLNQAFAALGLSLLGFTGYYLLLVLAIKDAGTEMPTLIIGTIPIWVMFLGKQQGLSFRSLLPGLLLTAGGLVLMGYVELQGHTDVGVVQSAEPANYWWGIAFAVISMVCWTLFAIFNSAWLKKHHEVSASDWANWLGVATGLGAWVLWLFAGSDLKTMTGDPKFASFALICIATGLGSAWLATIFWNIASQQLSASLCGQLIVSETVFALIYSSWWDGQLPALLAIVAGVMFVLGILASIKAHR